MKRNRLIVSSFVALSFVLGSFATSTFAAEPKQVVLIAGTPSHGYGAHEHLAGCRLLAKTIEQRGFDVKCTVVQNGWPADESVLDSADSIVMYCDGGGGHPAIRHLDKLGQLMDRGVGLVCLHYAVEVPTERGGAEFLKWLGGYFESNWSVNPHWVADFKSLPKHPITAGVDAFSSNDEWYFHMRFPEDMAGVTPILTAVAPESTMTRPDGPHEGNPAVRAAVAKGEPQHTAWAFERSNGGRSFGFTGGHYHWNWARADYSQLVTNAIAWTAKADVTDVNAAQSLTVEALIEGQDEAVPENFNPAAIKKEYSLTSAPAKSRSATASTTIVAGKKTLQAAYRSPLMDTTISRHQIDIDIPVVGAKKLFLVVTDAGNGFSCDWADWVNPTLVMNNGQRQKLTDQKWVRATSGYGRANVNQNCDGGPLKIRNQTFENGIGVHADSIVEYDLPTDCKSFEVIAGLDEGGTKQADGKQTSVQFFVYLDEIPKTFSGGSQSATMQREPKNAVAGLDVFEGLQAQLAASEPKLMSLTNIDVDHRGRVWACEVVNYRKHNGERAEGDRILILEDTDQDGVMDTEKVFYQGNDINSALGICVLGNRVLVSAAPYVWEFIDNDGDDKPDSKVAVFTKTGDPQHDHSVHSFVIGPDNRLYFNFGNTGHQLCDTNGQPFKDPWGRNINDSGSPYRQGMAFRCNQDFSNMEVVGHNFRNNYELAVDSFGSIWQSDNDDDGNRATRINFVMEYGNYGYTDEATGDTWQKSRTNMEAEIPRRHWHLNDPGVMPTMLITGAGSPTGITVYEGNLLPKPFQDTVIHCDAGPNIVRGYPTQVDGAGYSASIVNLVEGSRDKWFRPADVCTAPDGSLFISDWYDPGVGGHLMQDTERGRLFRVAPPGAKYEIPNYDLATVSGAVAALQNPNNSVRFLAMQALKKFGVKAEADLASLLKSDDPRIAARALWMLSAQPTLAGKYIKQMSSSDNSDLRIAAIRCGRFAKLPYSQFVDPMLRDANPQARRELAVALREDSSAEMPSRWTTLAQQFDGKDRWMLEALGVAAIDRWDDCLTQLLASDKTDRNSTATAKLIWRSRGSKSSQWIAELLKSENIEPTEIDAFFRALDFQKPDDRQKALLELLDLASNQE